MIKILLRQARLAAGAFLLLDLTANAQHFGSVDTSFAPQIRWNDSENPSRKLAIVLQRDQKLLVGGAFTEINGKPSPGLARLQSDGSIDPTFRSALEVKQVCAIATGLENEIYVEGEFIDGTEVLHLVRLNSSGSRDVTFKRASGGSGWAVQPDKKIVVTGSFRSINGVECYDLARLNVDDTVDANFAPPTHKTFDLSTHGGPVRIQPDGKILAGGYLPIAGSSITFLHRFNADGSLDASFRVEDQDKYRRLLALDVRSDGRLVVVASADEGGRVLVARLNPDGRRDPGFTVQPKLMYAIGGFAVQPDEKIVVAGLLQTSPVRLAVLRLQRDGQTDASFNAGIGPDAGISEAGISPSNEFSGAVVQADGKVILAGTFQSFDGSTKTGLARLHGSIDALCQITGRSADGAVRLRLVGEAGRNYQLQTSDDLRIWTSSKTYQLSATSIELTLQGDSAAGTQFYRVLRSD